MDTVFQTYAELLDHFAGDVTAIADYVATLSQEAADYIRSIITEDVSI